MSTVGGPNLTDSGLVLQLDAGNIKSYQSGSTTWFDKSGNAYNGTLTNGPTFDTGSLGSIVFDGIDDYVSFSTSIPITYTSSYTLSTWISADTVTSSLFRNIFGIASGGSISNVWQILAISSAGKVTYRSNTENNIADVISNITITAGKIYNFVLTLDNGNLTLYIDGSVDKTATVPVNFTPQPKQGISIGRFPNVNTQFLSGKVYNMYYYNRALTAQEVLQNYNATRTRFGL